MYHCGSALGAPRDASSQRRDASARDSRRGAGAAPLARHPRHVHRSLRPHRRAVARTSASPSPSAAGSPTSAPPARSPSPCCATAPASPGGVREEPAAAGGLGALRRADDSRPRSRHRRSARRAARAGRLRDRRDAISTIIGPSPIDYPIQPKEHGIDFLLDHRHFWLRSHRASARSSLIRNEIEQAIHDFFYERGFLRVDTPILTAAIGERSGLFATEYFEEGNAYLAQTGQLYGEAARGGVREDLHLRPDVPRREVEDAPAPHRVLDDRARGGVERLGRQHAAAGGLRLVPRAARARASRARSSRSSSATSRSSSASSRRSLA